MKTVIMGAGAIGSLVGALLYKAYYDVSLIGRKAHVDAISGEGLEIECREAIDNSIKELTKKPVTVPAFTNTSDFGVSDLVIITTKAYDTEQALKYCEGIISEQTNVLSLQNGLGLRKIVQGFLCERFDEEIAIRNSYGGITSNGVEFLGSGRIRYNGAGKTVIGNYFRQENGQDIVDMFNSAGLETIYSSDISIDIWSKFLINVGINALATYHGVRNGELAKKDDLKNRKLNHLKYSASVFLNSSFRGAATSCVIIFSPFK